MESCLWELASLKNHYLFKIPEQVSKFEEPLTSYQKLRQFLNQSYSTVSQMSLTRIKMAEDLETRDESVAIMPNAGTNVIFDDCHALWGCFVG